MRWPSLLCFLSLALVPPVLAQEPTRTTPHSEEMSHLRNEVNEVVDAYLTMKVQQRLDLTDEQLSKTLPLIRKYHQARRELEHRRFRLLRELRQMMTSGTATDERVAPMLRDLKGVELELLTAIRQGMEAIDATLTPTQQAKYRLLESDIDRRLRDLRHRARRHLGAPDTPGPDDQWMPRPGAGPRAPHP
jgi:hypothetical protein